MCIRDRDIAFRRFGDKIKNFPVAFPFVIIFGRSAYQAGTFRTGVGIQAVSYTHLDVYKRQLHECDPEATGNHT